MTRLPICAAVLVLMSACVEEPKPASGCEPTVPDGADAGGTISRDYPSCCFSVGVPSTSVIVATARGELPAGPIDPGRGGLPDAGRPDSGAGDGGVPMGSPWVAAREAFPAPVSARWTGTTMRDGAAALHLEVDGAAWTIAVAQSAAIPEPPASGVDVELTVDEHTLTMTRASDEVLLVAWVRFSDGMSNVLADRSVGGIELALGEACYGWEESGFGCGRGFLVYGLEASAGGASVEIAAASSGTLEVSSARYAITNRLISNNGGAPIPVCADFNAPVFDADVIIESL